MYTKTVNGRQVFSDCRTIRMPDGCWISNPTDDQILSAGWEPYIPQESSGSLIFEPDYIDIISAIKKMFENDIEKLSDSEALSVAALYPTWASKIGDTVAVGTRVWYNENLYRVIQSHVVSENWTPDISSSLYSIVSIEEWPEWRQPLGSEDTYNIGDCVTFENQHYISLIDNNIWSPAAYPAAWEKQV